MRKQIFILTVALVFSSALLAQKKSATVINIEGEKVTKTEFLSVYNKNNIEQDNSREALKEYLDLFINYKLKVKEAEHLGYDTLSNLQQELQGYRKQLAEPYLIDEEVNKALMDEAYDRMQYDVRAGHILFRVDATASAEDTLKAYNKALEVVEKIKNGASFDEMAVEYSEDPSARERNQKGRIIPGNKGDLGYFSVFDMVYPFESAVYSMEVGDVSAPVRTRFGYHLIKLKDKKDALGEAKVAHILVLLTRAKNAQDSTDAKARIDEVYQKLQEGKDFAELTKEYSDDKASARIGGELPWFGPNRMIPAFVEATYGLKEKEEFSKPFLTRFGWHIIKLIDKKPINSFEDSKEEIKKNISKNDRANKSKKSLVAKIRKENKAKVYQENALAIQEVIDSTIFTKNWSADTAKAYTAEVFTIGKISYTQYDFAQYVVKNQKRQQLVDIPMYLNTQLEGFIEEKAIAYEDSQLENKYPEFKALMKEYRDGILLFELTNDMVWNKAIEDTTGLKEFHSKHAKDYMWEQRANAKIITVLNEDFMEQARQLAAEGKSKQEIEQAINDSTSKYVIVREGKYEKDANDYIKSIDWKEGLSEVEMLNKRKFFVYIENFVEPEQKTLAEAKGLITADYQNYLEKNWIEQLRSKYSFKVKEKVFNSIKL